jgi:hypothetical protein
MATAWAFLSLMGHWEPFPANGHVNAAVTSHSLDMFLGVKALLHLANVCRSTIYQKVSK